MVLMLAFPTFIQQALSIRLEDRAAAGEAPTIGRAINYAPRWEGLDDLFSHSRRTHLRVNGLKVRELIDLSCDAKAKM